MHGLPGVDMFGQSPREADITLQCWYRMEMSNLPQRQAECNVHEAGHGAALRRQCLMVLPTGICYASSSDRSFILR